MKITLITATYNSEETLRDTFESVLRQTYRDYDYVVVDGASTDGTLAIIKEYEPRFEGRMRWVSERDKGIYDAMNKGISMGQGDVIGLLNSDDFFSSEDILETVAGTFVANTDADALYGNVHYVAFDNPQKTIRFYSSRVFRRGLMRLGFMPAHPSFYCKKSVYEKFKLDGHKIEGFKGNPDIAYFNTTYKIAADFENLLRMIFVGRIKTVYVHKDFVSMRDGGASSSGAASHNQINRDHLRAFKENGVYSNIFLLALRYLYKLVEMAMPRVNRLLNGMGIKW